MPRELIPNALEGLISLTAYLSRQQFPTPSIVAYTTPRGGGVKGGAAAERSSGTLDAAEPGDSILRRWRRLASRLTPFEPGATPWRCEAPSTGSLPVQRHDAVLESARRSDRRCRRNSCKYSARAVPSDVTRRGDIALGVLMSPLPWDCSDSRVIASERTDDPVRGREGGTAGTPRRRRPCSRYWTSRGTSCTTRRTPA